ncbi:MAG: alpha/beta hydrolase [Lachnospiraceae bacterium]|nr:alpha/beta hydrolase [Lachnospiraceae bacterium]
MGMYRKYMEPEYGKVAPETNVAPPQVMDMKNTEKWRIKTNYESMASMNKDYQKCACYEDVMSVKSVRDVCKYGDVEIPLKVFIPDGSGDFKTLIYYHGGGFAFNNIEVYEYIHRYLAFYGKMVIIAPDYRLAPEYKFPKGLTDAYETLLWTKENIKKYQGQADHINVAGDSAGGNFATVVSMMARDKKGPKIEKEVLIYPLTTNFETEETESEKNYSTGHFLDYNCMNDPMYFYFEHEEDKKSPYTSPLLAEDLSDMPITCFVSAECDPLLDQGLMYAGRLEDSGVSVEYHIMKGMVHGFINGTYGKTFEAMKYIIDFIQS